MALTAARFRNNSRIETASRNSPAIRQGERGEAVGIIQVALRDLGFAMPISFKHVFPDGIYGSETADRVRQFQQSKGLAADGVVGKNTLLALDESFRSEKDGAPPPFPQPDVNTIIYLNPPGPVAPPDVPPLPLARKGEPLSQPRLRPVVPRPEASRSVTSRFAGTQSLPGDAAGSSAGLVTAPLAKPILIGKRERNNCGDATLDDFKSNDFPKPKINILQQVSLNFLRTQSRLTLEAMWRSTFAALYNTGSLGQEMITRFMVGTGGVFRHASGSDLSNTAKNTVTFVAGHNAVKAEIIKQFAEQFANDATIDINKLSIVVNMPFSTFSPDTTIPPKFRAMIGGIHGIELFATEFTRTGAGSFDMKLLYKICDNFGVGNDDLYTPDLQAMWILQHETAGTKPFVNSIEIEESISATFTTVF
jgi:hypothetical protein